MRSGTGPTSQAPAGCLAPRRPAAVFGQSCAPPARYRLPGPGRGSGAARGRRRCSRGPQPASAAPRRAPRGTAAPSAPPTSPTPPNRSARLASAPPPRRQSTQWEAGWGRCRRPAEVAAVTGAVGARGLRRAGAARRRRDGAQPGPCGLPAGAPRRRADSCAVTLGEGIGPGPAGR